MATYEPDPSNVEAFWMDPPVRAFWLERADVVIATLSYQVDAGA